MPSEKTILKFLSKAKEASFQATYPRQHLGAVLVYGNKIIATGYNTSKTNPLQYKYNKYRNFKHFHAKNNGSVHAEGLVLLKTKYLDIDWGRCTLYIYRQFKGGEMALAKPCPGCYVALLERGIGEVIFTTAKEPYYEIWKLKGDNYG